MLMVTLGGILACGSPDVGKDARVQHEDRRPLAQRPPPLLVVSLPGAPRTGGSSHATPHLDALAAAGVEASGLVHAYPMTALNMHFTMVSGHPAQTHGVIADGMWDPRRRESFDLDRAQAVGDDSWFDAEPIWRSAARSGLVSANVAWPAAGVFLSPEAAGHGVDADSPLTERIQRVLAWLDAPADERPDLLTLHLGSGKTDLSGVTAAEDADAALGLLMRGLGDRSLMDRVNVLVVTVPTLPAVADERRIHLGDYLDLSRVRVSAWGGAAHLWASESMPVESIVAGLRGNRRLQVWRRDALPARFRLQGHPRVPDVIVQADPGWAVVPAPSTAAATDHGAALVSGGEPQHRVMHGRFVAHGPGFRSGASLPHLESLHLPALMTHLLDIEAGGHSGRLAAFAPGLSASVEDPGTPPPPAAVLLGERWIEPDSAQALAATRLNVHQRRRVFALTGTLQQRCDEAVAEPCIVELVDGDQRLELVADEFHWDPLLFEASLVAIRGQLEVDVPSRTWRLRTRSVVARYD